MQIFGVLRSVGATHALSACLLTGGKSDFAEEQPRVVRMALVVATPGRLLQHLEQTPGFDAGGLHALVLDEADRILDLGFAKELDSIISYLPRAPQRQTLLFSATQTRSVRALARLSLAKEGAEYLGVHEREEHATPQQLQQSYAVIPLPGKLDALLEVRARAREEFNFTRSMIQCE